jgi:hypothetical protein
MISVGNNSNLTRRSSKLFKANSRFFCVESINTNNNNNNNKEENGNTNNNNNSNNNNNNNAN